LLIEHTENDSHASSQVVEVAPVGRIGAGIGVPE
jgi:hypothetical protein